MKKYTVTNNATGQKITVPVGTLLSDAALELGIPLPTPCGGKGICGKCAVKAEGALTPPTGMEGSAGLKASEMRLACQAAVAGNIIIFPEDSGFSRTPVLKPLDPGAQYGIAVDIGTTTMEFAIINLETGEQHRGVQMLNPLRRWGDDVISRIAAATGEFEHQVNLLRSTILSEIEEMCRETGVPGENIRKIICSGNTTMQYFLAGIDVFSLGRHPYTAHVLDIPRITMDERWKNRFPNTDMEVLPVSSAFLGGDFMAGLALSINNGITRSAFFIDMGTNGEMFLITPDERIFATTCAMGPALEGMNMSAGMTATDGAITHVTMDNGSLVCTVKGGGRGRGIAGTGYIDMVAHLLNEGLVKPDGAFTRAEKEKLPSPLYEGTWNNIRSFFLQDGVPLTQADVRNLQLARGASFTAATLLLQEAGCDVSDINTVILAGAFGENIHIDNFRELSFLPGFSSAEWSFAGNTSLAGALRACTDTDFMERVSSLRERVTIVELTTHPRFNDMFMGSLDFQ